MRDLILPAYHEALDSLRTGEMVLLTGTVAAARDAAHKLMNETGHVPFDPVRIPVFYTGPSQAPPGMPCGSCGPTTSSRMEPFIPEMLRMGMRIAIGKGDMSRETRDLFRRYNAVYLAAVGGAGALTAAMVEERKVIAWDHLGPEAVSLLSIRKLPVFVAWDLHGNNIFDIHRRKT